MLCSAGLLMGKDDGATTQQYNSHYTWSSAHIHQRIVGTYSNTRRLANNAQGKCKTGEYQEVL